MAVSTLASWLSEDTIATLFITVNVSSLLEIPALFTTLTEYAPLFDGFGTVRYINVPLLYEGSPEAIV